MFVTVLAVSRFPTSKGEVARFSGALRQYNPYGKNHANETDKIIFWPLLEKAIEKMKPFPTSAF